MGESEVFEVPVPDQLVIDLSRDGATIVLRLAGELDLASAPLLEQQLEAAEAGVPARLVIDLGALDFMDSTGLQTLLRAHRRAADAEHELVLRPGPSQVQRVFELTRTVSLFTFED